MMELTSRNFSFEKFLLVGYPGFPNKHAFSLQTRRLPGTRWKVGVRSEEAASKDSQNLIK